MQITYDKTKQQIQPVGLNDSMHQSYGTMLSSLLTTLDPTCD